jgi:hypothetical protein
MKTSLATGIACLAVVYAPDSAAGVSSRLVYSRAADVSTCPDEAALRKAVADRLGYDPFVAYARTTVVAEVLRENDRLKAHAHWIDEEGILRGSRDLTADSEDCTKLVAALALAISIALDPMATARPDAEPEPEAANAVQIEPPKAAMIEEPETPLPLPRDRTVPPAPRRASTARTLTAEAGAGAFVATGTLPATSEGGVAFFRLTESPRASVAVEGQFELPASADAPGGTSRVTAWAWASSIVPCWHVGPAGICGLGTLGQLLTHGEGVANPRSEAALWAAVGLRALVGLRFSEAWGMELHGDISAPLVRNELSLNGSPVWRTPGILGALGAGIVARVW